MKKELQTLASLKLVELIDDKFYIQSERPPKTSNLIVDEITDKGIIYFRSKISNKKKSQHIIFLKKTKKQINMLNLKIGDNIQAKLKKISKNSYKVTLLKNYNEFNKEIFGKIKSHSKGFKLYSNDKKNRIYFVPKYNNLKIKDGDFVKAKIIPGKTNRYLNSKIIRVLGKNEEHVNLCKSVAKENEIPIDFSDAVKKILAEPIKKPLGIREDLRSLPFITIDPENARDHDDAIWANKDQSKLNIGGWKIKVAIADVAHYILAGSPIDKEALKRSNSVYFPNYTIPMLPEVYSNDLCSLKLNKDRPVLVANITINSKGEKIDHYFSRSIISPVANLSYQEAQETIETKLYTKKISYLKNILKPLFNSNNCIELAKKKRKPLDLHSSEIEFSFNKNGSISHIKKIKTHTSNKIVENFMILANICAAETLKEKKFQCIYRIHEKPNSDKLENLNRWLSNLSFDFPYISKINNNSFNKILQQSRKLRISEIVSQGILRAQSQAIYSIENKGHFGLALPNYCHFTSPIRRYSDLIIHRLLISACNLEKNGQNIKSQNFRLISEKISYNERKATVAERKICDILFAKYFSNKISNIFSGYISDINTYGIFITLNKYGASGLIKYTNSGRKYFFVNNQQKNATVKNSGKVWKIGDKVRVKLISSDVISGRLNFQFAKP